MANRHGRMKLCSSCGETKPLTEFHINRAVKSGKASRCKICRCKDQQKYRKARPEYYAYREWLRRLREYGLTENEWLVMLAAQSHKCKICGQQPVERLCVDHCHQTNVVRGLLCTSCNLALGQFKDSPVLLRNAIKYLEEE